MPSGRTRWRALRPGLEWEFETIVLPREWSRNAITRLLVQKADSAGWELDRVRIAPDGKRRIRLRRKIIRQRPDVIFLLS